MRYRYRIEGEVQSQRIGKLLEPSRGGRASSPPSSCQTSRTTGHKDDAIRSKQRPRPVPCPGGPTGTSRPIRCVHNALRCGGGALVWTTSTSHPPQLDQHMRISADFNWCRHQAPSSRRLIIWRPNSPAGRLIHINAHPNDPGAEAAADVLAWLLRRSCRCRGLDVGLDLRVIRSSNET